jgi:peroxiredoxin Q/BCP
LYFGKQIDVIVVSLAVMSGWFFSDPLPVGSQAPDFTLADETGKRWTLSSLRGKNVLLVFYPGDNTPG